MKQCIKLITHNDLDGVGAFIVAKLLMKDCKIDWTFCGNIESAEKHLLETFNTQQNYDHIYMVDISVSKQFVETHLKSSKILNKFTLIDHHKTAEWLNQYEFAHVNEEVEGKLMSGTYLFYKWLCCEYEYDYTDDIHQKLLIDTFVESVRRWDTWDWKKNPETHESRNASMLNRLLYIKGAVDFAHDMHTIIEEDYQLFSQFDMQLIRYEDKRKDRYLKAKCKDVFIRDLNGYCMGVVFAEQYISELGNYIAEEHPELDFVAIIGAKTVNYRTLKDNVDVSEIAAMYDGGGHQRASGNPINPKKKLQYIENLFEVE